MKTRATALNPHNRFQPIVTDREADHDWYHDPEDDLNPDTLATEVVLETAKSIISRNTSPDVPFDQSINPYRGCEHACIYCFARPTHAYWDMSPGLDFETRLIAKPNAAARLREELDRPAYRVSPIALGVNTDAYQPLERDQRITRQVLEVLAEYRHPVSIITKGALILRDLDLLREMASDGLCSVRISLTSLSNDLKRRMEPRTAAPATRLKMIRQLSEAGIPTGIILGQVGNKCRCGSIRLLHFTTAINASQGRGGEHPCMDSDVFPSPHHCLPCWAPSGTPFAWQPMKPLLPGLRPWKPASRFRCSEAG